MFWQEGARYVVVSIWLLTHHSNLYSGFNNHNQHVFSWLPESNVTTVNADFSPLVHYLWQSNALDSQVYLGSVAFGTENFFAHNETVFSTHDYLLNVMSSNVTVGSAITSSTKPKSGVGGRRLALEVGYYGTPLLVLGLTALVMC